MSQILLTRLSLLAGFSEFFRTIGAPVERQLRYFALPTNPDPGHEAFVPVVSAGRFVRAMTQREGIDDIVFQVMRGKKVGDVSASGLTSRPYAPTLLTRMTQFAEFVTKENPNFRFSWERGQTRTRFLLHVTPIMRKVTAHYSDWTLVLQFLSIIREFAGSGWHPEEVTFQPKFTMCGDAMEELPDTRLLFGQAETSLVFPSSLLSLGGFARSARGLLDEGSSRGRGSADSQSLDFPTSLKLSLYAYLAEEHLDVNLAAEIASTSVRTLQRRLIDHGVTYSDVLEQARFDVASDLLVNSEAKIIDVAYSVGYEDPSNFARAFRRMSGFSPREYRVGRRPLEEVMV